MSEQEVKLNGKVFSIVGVGMAAAALSRVVGFLDSILVAVGLGLMVGGVFYELRRHESRK